MERPTPSAWNDDVYAKVRDDTKELYRLPFFTVVLNAMSKSNKKWGAEKLNVVSMATGHMTLAFQSINPRKRLLKDETAYYIPVKGVDKLQRIISVDPLEDGGDVDEDGKHVLTFHFEDSDNDFNVWQSPEKVDFDRIDDVVKLSLNPNYVVPVKKAPVQTQGKDLQEELALKEIAAEKKRKEAAAAAAAEAEKERTKEATAIVEANRKKQEERERREAKDQQDIKERKEKEAALEKQKKEEEAKKTSTQKGSVDISKKQKKSKDVVIQKSPISKIETEADRTLRIDSYSVNANFKHLYSLWKLLLNAGSAVSFDNWGMHKLVNTFNVNHCMELHVESDSAFLIKPIFLYIDQVYRLLAVRLTRDKGVYFVFGSRNEESESLTVEYSMEEMKRFFVDNDKQDVDGSGLVDFKENKVTANYFDYSSTYPVLGTLEWAKTYTLQTTWQSDTGLITTKTNPITPETRYFAITSDGKGFKAPSLHCPVDSYYLRRFFFGREQVPNLESLLARRGEKANVTWYNTFDCPLKDIDNWESITSSIVKNVNYSYVADFLPLSAEPKERSVESIKDQKDASKERVAQECLSNLQRVQENIDLEKRRYESLEKTKEMFDKQAEDMLDLLLELLDRDKFLPEDLVNIQALLGRIENETKADGERVLNFKSPAVTLIEAHGVNMDMLYQMSETKQKLRECILSGPYSLSVNVRGEAVGYAKNGVLSSSFSSASSMGKRISSTAAVVAQTPVMDLLVRNVNTTEINNKTVCGTMLNDNVSKSFNNTLGLEKKGAIPVRGVLSIQLKNQETGKLLGTRKISYNVDTKQDSPYYMLEANDFCIFAKAVDASHVELKMLVLNM